MKNVLKIAIWLQFLALSYNAANAQSLISSIANSGANLNSVESQRYSNLQQDAFTKELTLANLGNPSDFVNAQCSR
jgi:hypothetical protein